MSHMVGHAACGFGPVMPGVRRPEEGVMLLLFKNLLFTVLVPGTVAVYIPLSIAASTSGPHSPAWGIWQLISLIPISTGAAIYFWCLWDFAMHGHGTPAPIDAPKQLVARGLYRYVRNPMYIGVLLVIGGWAVYFQSWGIVVYVAAIGLFFHIFVVKVEEPILRRKFGEGYLNYSNEVGRWVPRVWRRQDA